MWRGIILAIGLSSIGIHAAADAIHHVRFTQPATVLVWQNDMLIGKGSRVSISDQTASADAEFVGAGRLLPVSDRSTESPQSIQIDIASNAGFAIKVSNPNLLEAAHVRVLTVGANAIYRGAPSDEPAEWLFVQSSKTAEQPGSPKSQALSLELSWTAPNDPGFEIIALTP